MEYGTLIIAMGGILAGTLHVLSGPDHLAAIAPFAARNPYKSWRIGLSWGMGHTGSVWMVALLVFLLKGILPLDGISQWGERIVGVVLVGVGLWGIQKSFNRRVHWHVHDHNGIQHAHFHSHSIQEAHSFDQQDRSHSQHVHAPLGIGVVHGFAGSSHLLAILPALSLPGQYRAFGYIAGFGIGTIFSMMCFSWLIGLLQKRIIHRFAGSYRLLQVSFSVLAVAVGIFWLTNLS